MQPARRAVRIGAAQGPADPPDPGRLRPYLGGSRRYPVQERVHVVFSEDRFSATVTCERWDAGQRVSAYVFPPLRVMDDPLCLAALDALLEAFPTLFP